MSDLAALLDRLSKEPSKTVGKIILPYGATKIGKTTLCVQGPKPILIEIKDKSSEVLKESGQIDSSVPVVQAKDWTDLLDILKSLEENEHEFKTAILDGGSGSSELCDQYVIDNDCDGSKEKFLAFGRGDRLAAFEWARFLEALDALKSKGMTVFLICHQGTVTVKNPLGDDYLKVVPHLSKEKLAMTTKYVDAILFMTTIIAQKDVNEKTGIGKVAGGESRIMWVRPSAAYEAGNRLNLPNPIMLGNTHQEAFKAFREAVKQGRKQGQ